MMSHGLGFDDQFSLNESLILYSKLKGQYKIEKE